MNSTLSPFLVQRFQSLQYELIPSVRDDLPTISNKLEQVIRVLEWSNIESEVYFYRGAVCGRPPTDRCALACSFIAKSVLGLVTTNALIERLTIDRALRRICGFDMYKKIPDKSIFSKAFAQFSASGLMTRVHEEMVKKNLGDALIGHLSRDSTMIPARERVAKKSTEEADKPVVKKRGRPRKDAPVVEQVVVLSAVEKQLPQTLAEMLEDLPQHCSVGTKANAKGFKESTKGYKLHLDTACCGVVISAYLTGAEVHDSRVALPLSLISEKRVTACYEVMDAGYCSNTIRAFVRSKGRVALIDHNKRKGEKIEFCPADAQRYKTRSGAERSNARLKDEFGGRVIYYRGHEKIMSHLMFGLVAQTADQLMRLLI
jgi:hypothetical protein